MNVIKLLQTSPYNKGNIKMLGWWLWSGRWQRLRKEYLFKRSSNWNLFDYTRRYIQNGTRQISKLLTLHNKQLLNGIVVHLQNKRAHQSSPINGNISKELRMMGHSTQKNAARWLKYFCTHPHAYTHLFCLTKCFTHLLFLLLLICHRLGFSDSTDNKDPEDEVNDYLMRAIDARSIDRLRSEHCKSVLLSFKKSSIEQKVCQLKLFN